MENQNYYLLLELSYDPPDHNDENIKAAILKKRSVWSKRLSNSKYRSEAEEILKILKDAENDLKDKQFRIDEAKRAKAIVEKARIEKEKEQFKRLDHMIFILSKRGFIYEHEIELMANEFSFSQADIKKRITSVKVRKDTKKTNNQAQPALTKEKMGQIDSLLHSLKIKAQKGNVPTLYDLLTLPESAR